MKRKILLPMSTSPTGMTPVGDVFRRKGMIQANCYHQQKQTPSFVHQTKLGVCLLIFALQTLKLLCDNGVPIDPVDLQVLLWSSHGRRLSSSELDS